MELRGLEPLTPCLQSKPEPSLSVALGRPVCRSPAAILARRGWVSPGPWRHWLPTWLPKKALSSANSFMRDRAAARSSGPDRPTRRHMPDSAPG